MDLAVHIVEMAYLVAIVCVCVDEYIWAQTGVCLRLRMLLYICV